MSHSNDIHVHNPKLACCLSANGSSLSIFSSQPSPLLHLYGFFFPLTDALLSPFQYRAASSRQPQYRIPRSQTTMQSAYRRESRERGEEDRDVRTRNGMGIFVMNRQAGKFWREGGLERVLGWLDPRGKGLDGSRDAGGGGVMEEIGN